MVIGIYELGVRVRTYIILLRGVNVGGKNLLPMKELKKALEDNGLENVKTYIQSGNIVASSVNNPESKIRGLIESNFGFSPEVLVLSNKEYDLAVSNNPFKEFEGKFVHFYFCKESPELNIIRIKKLSSDSENHRLIGGVFYLHAPAGIGRSKLVSNIEACLGVSVTGRNLNTVNKIKEMVINA